MTISSEPVLIDPPESPVAGQVWHDPVSDIDMVWIPEGCFQMGCVSGIACRRCCLPFIKLFYQLELFFFILLRINPSFFVSLTREPLAPIVGGNLALLAGCGPMGLEAIDYALHGERKPRLLVMTCRNEARLRRAETIYPVQHATEQRVTLPLSIHTR